MARWLICGLALAAVAACASGDGDAEDWQIGFIEEADQEARRVVLYPDHSFVVAPDTNIWWKWLRRGVEVKVRYVSTGEQRIATRVGIVHVEEHSDRSH